MEADIVLFPHGDFNPNNILIDNVGNRVWFIDFEYSLSAPIYYDIGKIFRENGDMDQYIAEVPMIILLADIMNMKK